MAGYPALLPQISPSQAAHEVTANANFAAVSPAGLFGINADASAALSLGLIGGCLAVAGVPTQIANQVVTLTASTTNYVKSSSAGVVSVVTSAPSGWPGPLAAGVIALYTIITGSGSISGASGSIVDHRAPLLTVAGALLAANNLLDVASVSSSRTNLGLGTAAVLASSALIHADGSIAFGADQSLGSHKLTNVTDPSSAQDAATKAYVDALAVNLGKRARVRAATTANITIATALNNGDTLDGATLATGDLVLVKNQSAPAENGVYVVGVTPARDAQFDTYDEHPGSLLAVEEGSTNADTLWLCTSNAGGTLDTTAIAFSALSVSAAITQLTGDGTAGPGSGSQALTLATVNSNIGSFGDATHVAAVTVNAKGLVTAASAVAITGAAPTGSAGGDLTGTYPNPTIAANAVTLADMAQIATAHILGRTTAATGNVESLTATQAKAVLAIASSDVSGLASVATSGSAADLSAGTLPAARMPALTGDATTVAGAVATTLATVNGNVGSFGDGTHVAAVTLNAKGLATAASSVAITGIALTEAPSNQTATGIIVSLTYGESIVPGDVLYFKSDGKVWKADANGSSTYPAMGLALETASSGSHLVLLNGIYRDDSLYNWTVGGVVYLSTTAGAATQTAPASTDDVTQVLGVATHADRIYFNPQLDIATHT